MQSRKIYTKVMSFCVVAVVLLALTGTETAAQTIRYVSLDGSHDTAGGYQTWQGAAKDIRSALVQAADGDIILISNGVYNLVEQMTHNFIDVTNRVTFRGYSANREDVIIDGGGTKQAFRLIDEGCAGTVIECLTISNCSSSAHLYGGGIYMSQNTPHAITVTNVLFVNNRALRGGGGYFSGATITDCTFSNNSVPNGVAYQWGGGGAIYGPNGGGNKIKNCIFIDNYSDALFDSSDGHGGAVMFSSACTAPPEDSDNLIENCQFINNRSQRSGGAIYDNAAHEDSFARIVNCTFTANVSGADGGGVCAAGTARLTIEGSVFSHNTASAAGGGVMSRATSQFLHIRDTLLVNNQAATGGGFTFSTGWNNLAENCRVINNQAVGDNGGGVYVFVSVHSAPEGYSGGILRDCLITGNTAAADGGGIYANFGGKLVNCLLASNSAGGNGGGMCIDRQGNRGGFNVNCTIAGNTAAYGGGVHFGSNSGSINNMFTNTIVYGNQSLEDPGRPDIWFHGVAAVAANQKGQFRYCCASADLPAENGNLTADPLFENSAAENYRLATGSPCINTAEMQDWMLEANVVDLDGRPRLDRFSGKIDMGCYEFVPPGMMFILR